jgi:hypothetical protein
MAGFAGVVAQMAKAAPVATVNWVGALTLSSDSLEWPAGRMLMAALQALDAAGKASVAVVIEEALPTPDIADVVPHDPGAPRLDRPGRLRDDSSWSNDTQGDRWKRYS